MEAENLSRWWRFNTMPGQNLFYHLTCKHLAVLVAGTATYSVPPGDPGMILSAFNPLQHQSRCSIVICFPISLTNMRRSSTKIDDRGFPVAILVRPIDRNPTV